MEGLLPRRCRMFDTPGVPHPFQLHARLNPEEVLLGALTKPGQGSPIFQPSWLPRPLRATPAVVYSATEPPSLTVQTYRAHRQLAPCIATCSQRP